MVLWEPDGKWRVSPRLEAERKKREGLTHDRSSDLILTRMAKGDLACDDLERGDGERVDVARAREDSGDDPFRAGQREKVASDVQRPERRAKKSEPHPAHRSRIGPDVSRNGRDRELDVTEPEVRDQDVSVVVDKDVVGLTRERREEVLARGAAERARKKD